ncbi:aerolysin family beta-barrel pore-forming toxin [Vibrio ostreicida]|uniref:aerolysin family beta-barrel pore-forming toxin n=1 Tax=Vibrio ostreicida TaxID=526588 RepID=UPI003B5BDE3F
MKYTLPILATAMTLTSLSLHASPPPHVYGDKVFRAAPGTTIDGAEVIVNHYSFYKPLYRFGHGLGFAWAGAKGFDRQIGSLILNDKVGSDYHLYPNPKYSDPDVAGTGPYTDNRLEIFIENIRFYMTGEDLTLYDAELLEQEPKAFQKAVMYNCDSQLSDSSTAVIRHTEGESWSKGKTNGISSDIGVKSSFSVNVKVPLTAEYTATSEFSASFGTDNSWSSSNGGDEQIAHEQRYTTTIPPRSKKTLNLTYVKSKSRIPYKNKIVMSYDIKLKGFLRERDYFTDQLPEYLHTNLPYYPLYNDWKGNAYRPTDIGRYDELSYRFGSGVLDAQQDIKSQYVNFFAGNQYAGPWDWNKYITSMVQSTNQTCRDDSCVSDMDVWQHWRNQPLAEVLRRYVVEEEGAFEIEATGLFHVTSSQAEPMTAEEFAVQCRVARDGKARSNIAYMNLEL